MKCKICDLELDDYTAYEYRGAFACADHFDEVCEQRDQERQWIINEEDQKTKKLKGLDLSDSVIGKENRKLLKGSIEVASRESARLRDYEGR
ncbi:MAG: hypothetical protein Unbinned6284contig1001_49 [Prokaryotic dsDNA virus sp.]|nr:MAG: hypothetical protein Unbinned6284contig1001_49 [Prokaryotic dsDNA virus sp.]|tara:strand:+ start:4804 stop:5079 length:276 start_codon:yes stop_codon:yes gene_type:complete